MHEMTHTADHVPSLSTAQWRADIQFFADEVHQHHKNAFHHVGKEQFTQAVAALDAHVPHLKNYEIVVGLQRLAAMIGDGHTFVATWDVFRSYPFALFWFDADLRVVRATAADGEALGARVVEIGGMGIADVHTRLQQVIPQGENSWYVLQQSAEQIVRAEMLAALGIVSSIEHAGFTFEDDQGKQWTLTVPSVAPNTTLDWIDVAQNIPLCLQQPHESFWFTYLSETQTMYVCFRGYSGLEQHTRSLFEALDQQPATRLVIDLRQNGGGNFDLARRHFIPALKQRHAINALGRLFVITGRKTFSAAMTNAIDFRNETQALLVGEPVGARPNGYQENYWCTLPHSRLRASIASRYYHFQDDDTVTVLPDYTILPDWTAYAQGRDPVLDWITSTPITP